MAEDDTQLRRAIFLKLSFEGYTVWEAETADQVMEILNVRGIPDVVLTDVEMPGKLNGIDVLDHLKRSFPNLPVIVMSGSPYMASAVAAAIIQADVFLEKPIVLETLSQFIRRFARAV